MAPSLRWRSGVGPDAPGYWWCRMRLLSVDFDGRDESLYCGDWTPVLCEAFGNPMEVRVISGRGSWTFPVIQWNWVGGGCAPVKPAPKLHWRPLARKRHGVRATT